MPHLEENSVRVMRVLENHPALDALQIASRAELSVTSTHQALEELKKFGLITTDAGIYWLDSKTLSQMLEAA